VIANSGGSTMLPGHEQHHTPGIFGLAEPGKGVWRGQMRRLSKDRSYFYRRSTPRDSATLKVARLDCKQRLAESAIEAVGGRCGTLQQWPGGHTSWRIPFTSQDTPSLWNLHRENRVSFRLEQI